MSKLKKDLDIMRKNLDSLTLKELNNNPDLQRELSDILVTINDYIKLMNPWNRALYLKDPKSVDEPDGKVK